MLADARSGDERQKAMRIALSAGIELHEIESIFDQADASGS
jgi:hypothetical protein